MEYSIPAGLGVCFSIPVFGHRYLDFADGIIILFGLTKGYEMR